MCSDILLARCDVLLGCLHGLVLAIGPLHLLIINFPSGGLCIIMGGGGGGVNTIIHKCTIDQHFIVFSYLAVQVCGWKSSVTIDSIKFCAQFLPRLKWHTSRGQMHMRSRQYNGMGRVMNIDKMEARCFLKVGSCNSL